MWMWQKSPGDSFQFAIPPPSPSMSQRHLVTTVVGSYPQPGWLIDRERLGDRLPPRIRARELWRVPDESLEEAQDDATRLAVDDMERAGVDVITDGEMRRESYSNRFATALEGVDLDHPGVAVDRTGHENPVPRVVKDKPAGYSFLRELNGCRATHLSLEAAQPSLDAEVLREVPDKTIVLGVLDLSDDAAAAPPE